MISVIVTLPRAVEWIKFNYNQVGYYRVNYPTTMWENLANKLAENPKVNYSQLIFSQNDINKLFCHCRYFPMAIEPPF